VQVDPSVTGTWVTVDVELPGTGTGTGSGSGTGPASWSARAVGPNPERVTTTTTQVMPATAPSGAVVVRTRANLPILGPYDAPVDLITTSFRPPGAVPVVVSGRLASATGVGAGGLLDLTVGTTPVAARVTSVVPDVPSEPGAPAVLADTDLVSRALLAAGDLQVATNGWWVGGPTTPDAQARVRALGLGTVVTRAGTTDELTGGPLRVVFPVALASIVPIALLLVLAGAALNVTADLEARAVELAQLRAVGLRRADLARGLVAQHGALLALLVAIGAAVGGAATRLIAPLLVRSDTGAEAVPEVVPSWPWAAEALLLGVHVAGCAVVVAVIVSRRVRRADPAHLRLGAA